MNDSRMTTIVARFLNDVVEETDRARKLFPNNHHMLGAMHEEVGEVAKAFLERDYKSTTQPISAHNYGLDIETYRECVQAAAMVLRVATEGDPEYRYENPYYREMDVDDIPVPVDSGLDKLAISINVNEVQVQVDTNNKGVRLTHQPTGCFSVCDKHDTQWENQAAGLKELDALVVEHLQWGSQDDALVIPAFLRRQNDE